MENTQVQDAITRKQFLFLEVTEKNVLDLFQDENLMQILTFLRSTPHMTVKDLEQAFIYGGNEKSTKSIYRYLKKLEDGNLVVPAGKRVTASPNEKLKTETLYMRTAKIFFPKMKDTELDPEAKAQHLAFDKVLGKLLGLHLGKEKIDVSCISLLTKKLKSSMFASSTSLFKSADEETANLVSSLDWKNVNSLIDILGLLALLSDDFDWKQEIISCFE
ncbi:MAG: hypothetical protein ACW98F_08870 [Candidatus Hodarchaeales archaeon]|jgi:hypothetical protein